MSDYSIEAGTAQHVGSRRYQHDRVALYTAPRAPGYLLAVAADGGASPVGAGHVLQTARQLFEDFYGGDRQRIEALLHAIARETHDVLLRYPDADNPAGAPRSTLVLLLLTPQHEAFWATVGHSRLYRFAGGACTGRSGDAGYIAHLIAVDKVPAAAAATHHASRLLANVAGNPLKAPFVSVGMRSGLAAGDAFLLCTDGLWSCFADDELAAAVSRRRPREAAQLLVDKARERAPVDGDNCSMAIVRLVAPPT